MFEGLKEEAEKRTKEYYKRYQANAITQTILAKAQLGYQSTTFKKSYMEQEKSIIDDLLQEGFSVEETEGKYKISWA